VLVKSKSDCTHYILFTKEPIAKLFGGVSVAIFWLAKGGVRSKLQTVCENEHEARREIARKTPQIVLQLALKTFLAKISLMTDKLQSTDGIVLHVLPFRDYDKILTLYTRDLGVIKVIIRKSLMSKISRGSIDPLTRAEFVLSAGKNDLFRCEDISLQNQNLKLREHLPRLQAACDMAYAITSSQMLHKPSSELYNLFISFLERLPLISDPEILLSSFYIKLLRHEGLLLITDFCSICRAPLSNSYLAKGERFCKEHAPNYALSFSKTEAEMIQILNFSRSFRELSAMELTRAFAMKIKDFFTMTLRDSSIFLDR